MNLKNSGDSYIVCHLKKYTFAAFMGRDKRPTTNVTEENLLTYVMKSLNHGCRVGIKIHDHVNIYSDRVVL